MSSTILRARPDRRIPAMITAILLLALAVLVVGVSVQALAQDTDAAGADYLTDLTWDSAVFITAAIIVALLGLVLVLCAIIPGSPAFSTMHDPDPHAAQNRGHGRDRSTIMTSNGISRLAIAEAQRVDGVVSAGAYYNGKEVSVNVSTPVQDPGPLTENIKERITGRLQSAGLTQVPRVRVNSRKAEG